jgi:hypothetical protein
MEDRKPAQVPADSCRWLDMRFGGRYVLGIDALPRGNYAAIVVGRTVTDTFAIATEGRCVLPLEERVRIAVDEARHRRGVVPDEVRLVCIDDGADGSDLGRLGQWLEVQLGVRIQILEPVGAGPAPTVSDVAQPAADECARSIARACDAALW